MAALTFFLATSPSKTMLSPSAIEKLLLELIHEQHLFLPAAILVGTARNEVRGDEFDAAAKAGMLLSTSRSIIPNEPESMLQVVRDHSQGKITFPETLWYYGDDEAAFVQALRRAPIREHDVCFCFPSLSPYLSDHCGWDQGAVLYTLTHPFHIDFMDILGTTALPLIDYPTSDFFTLSSFCLGGFPDTTDHPLAPILLRAFGPDCMMRQTSDLAAEEHKKDT